MTGYYNSYRKNAPPNSAINGVSLDYGRRIVTADQNAREVRIFVVSCI